MSNQRQTEANRRNALLSTGPRTLAGKATAALNAVKHGLLSREVLLPGEDADALEELRECLQTEFQPVGGLEGLLVDRIAAVCWRLRRLGRVESGIFIWQLYESVIEQAEREVQAYERTEDLDPAFLMELAQQALALGVTTAIKKAKNCAEAEAKLQALRSQQEAGVPILGLAFVRDATGADALTKLSRYEIAIEKSLYKALHELQRLQAVRAGQLVQPPTVVDVNVEFSSSNAA